MNYLVEEKLPLLSLCLCLQEFPNTEVTLGSAMLIYGILQFSFLLSLAEGKQEFFI